MMDFVSTFHTLRPEGGSRSRETGAQGPPLLPLLMNLAQMEASLVEQKAAFLQTEIERADDLVTEAAVTLGFALRGLNDQVRMQFDLVFSLHEALARGGRTLPGEAVLGTLGTLLEGQHPFVKGMLEMAHSSMLLAKELDDLKDRSDTTGQMLGELSEVARRIRFLALSAATEAAQGRFGHAGRIAGEQPANREEALDLLARLRENARRVAEEVSSVVRSLQFQDMVRQIVQSCQGEFKNLQERVAAWRSFEKDLGVDGIETNPAIGRLLSILGKGEGWS